jgi:hypothetical protein
MSAKTKFSGGTGVLSITLLLPNVYSQPAEQHWPVLAHRIPLPSRGYFATVDHDLSITTDDENERHNKNCAAGSTEVVRIWRDFSPRNSVTGTPVSTTDCRLCFLQRAREGEYRNSASSSLAARWRFRCV